MSWTVQRIAGLTLWLALADLTAWSQSVPAKPEMAAPRQIPIREVLVIESVGRYGRAPVHVDALEAELVVGRWRPPEVGQAVTLADGSTRTWQAAAAGEDGWIRHAALSGGYAYAAVPCDAPRAMWLEATAHGVVYVNGEPRPGDPYQTGYVRLPVWLHEGTNDLLFQCGRGELRATLTEPAAPVSLDVRDVTLPDLILDERVEVWAAVVVINAASEPLRDARLAVIYEQNETRTELPPIPAMTVRKVGLRIEGPEPDEPGTTEVAIALEQGPPARARVLDRATLNLRVRRPEESCKYTFISAIDGSVQYYALQPQRASGESTGPPALVLTLHGAGVEAIGQADAYQPKSWAHIVAPTNRRPYGFDWEDWGRLDALEVLEIAQETLGTDPRRTYLTGHSMGGHGVWQIGALMPGRFAAIAPSAGWISFWSYAGAAPFENPTPVEEILKRATNPSDTLAWSRNFLQYGIYVLHGEQDDNVPVEQARTMRRHLAEYHPDFAYYERPGAGHWWGNACVDWPPLFNFLDAHTRPAAHKVHALEFVTASPAVSATCEWATIEAQQESLALSKVDLKLDPKRRLIQGNTENVRRLGLALSVEGPFAAAERRLLLLPDHPLDLELDGQALPGVEWPADERLCVERGPDGWSVCAARTPADAARPRKTPKRSGPFKDAFRQRVQLVYGTRGTPDENAWALAKARYDAETFWYRGNGALDVLADVEFDPAAEPQRGVVLYGNADTNAAWRALFGQAPVEVRRGRLRVGEQELTGDDLAVLAAYPRPDSSAALVGVVSGTGLPGMRLTERLPYFLSGVAYPDWIVLGPEILASGTAGIRGAGFFDSEWKIDPDQSASNVP